MGIRIARALLAKKDSVGVFAELSEQEIPPEKKLLCAIVFRALLDAHGSIPGIAYEKGKAAQAIWKCVRKARDFIFDDREDLFSFRWICRELVEDEETLIQAVRNLCQREDAIEILGKHSEGGVLKNFRLIDCVKKLYVK